MQFRDINMYVSVNFGTFLCHFFCFVVWTSVVLFVVYITFRTSKGLFTGSYSTVCLEQDACKRLWF